MKFVVIALVGLSLALVSGFAMVGTAVGSVAVQSSAQEAAGVTVPMTNYEVGAESATELWIIDHDAQHKWTVTPAGLQSEALQAEREYHDCGLGRSFID